VDALPDVARRLAEEAADALDGPPDYAGHAALVVAGASAGAAVALEVKPGWREQAALYAALVGPSGNSKTPALRLVADPVFRAQEALNTAYEQNLLEYADEHADWARGGRQGDEPARRPVLPRLHVGDMTTACVAGLLVQNPRGLLLIRDELRGWLASMGEFSRGSSGDRPRWLSSWSGDPIVRDRRGDQAPVLVYRPFVAVLGGLVPANLVHFAANRRAARGAHALEDDDGLLARFTFSFPDARRVGTFHTRAVQDQTLRTWGEALRWLRGLPMRCGEGGTLHPEVVPFTPGGLEAFAAFYNRVAADINDDPEFPDELRPGWLKLRSQAGRLALAVHLLRRAEAASTGGAGPGTAVDAASVGAAVRLARYFGKMLRRVAGAAGEGGPDRRATAVLRWLVRRRAGPIVQFKPWQFLQQRHGARFRKVEDVTPALELLTRHHYLRAVRPAAGASRPGRPEDVTYEVNPQLYTDPALVTPDEGGREARGGE
jgi:hypothetical protein